MRRFSVVTTCHAAGYQQHGRQMAHSFVRHWPAEVMLRLYHEGFAPPIVPGRIEGYDLEAACPKLLDFKSRHADNPRAHGRVLPWRRLRVGPVSMPVPPLRSKGAPYRWDAVRFSHKCYALFDAARRSDADVLIWIDADSLFFADVTIVELESIAPASSLVACLRRPGHTECGFVAYNLRHPEIGRFLAEFEAMYNHDLLFDEAEFHDSHLFDVVRARAEQGGAEVHDIAEGVGWRAPHVLVNSRLGQFMDHMKGERKVEGSSRAEDLVVARTEDYWLQRAG